MSATIGPSAWATACDEVWLACWIWAALRCAASSVTRTLVVEGTPFFLALVGGHDRHLLTQLRLLCGQRLLLRGETGLVLFVQGLS